MTNIIKRVDTRVHKVDLPKAPSFANRTVPFRSYVVVRIETETGVLGEGFTPCNSSGAEVVAGAVEDLLAPVVVGRDSWDVEALWADMYQEVLLHGRAGSVMRALSAVDIALWDANARSVQKPLWKLLGGARDRVPAYASGGYYFDGKGPQELADEMESYVKAGFRAVKMKVGRGDLVSEEARIAAVRERVGDEVLVMLDANNAWKDLISAERAMRMFEKYDPYWIEEPFSPDDKLNHARLAQRTSVPVATGEIEAGRWAHLELLRNDAVHILQTDVTACGGITEFKRISNTAASFGIPMAPHAYHGVHIHLALGLENVAFVEYFTDNHIVNYPSITTDMPKAEDGYLKPLPGPGIGYRHI